MGMAAMLFHGVELFEQNVNILSTKGPMRNLVKNCSSGFREKFHDFIHAYGPGAWADNPQ